ncbi:MAG: hypothetical protein R3D00_18380 [Bacteroidia bacterium]
MLYEYLKSCSGVEYIDLGEQTQAIDFGTTIDEKFRLEYGIQSGTKQLPAQANTFVFLKLKAGNFGVVFQMGVFDRNGGRKAWDQITADLTTSRLYNTEERQKLIHTMISQTLNRSNLQSMAPGLSFDCLPSSPDIPPIKSYNLLFDIKRATLQGNTLEVEMVITNLGTSRDIEFYAGISYPQYSRLVDQKGKSYQLVNISSYDQSTQYQFSLQLAKNIPTPVTFSFKEADSELEFISRIFIQTYNQTDETYPAADWEGIKLSVTR